MGRNTFRLFSTPSLLSGAARALDLGATFDVYNTSATGEDADLEALAADFRAVGDDLHEAVRIVAAR